VRGHVRLSGVFDPIFARYAFPMRWALVVARHVVQPCAFVRVQCVGVGAVIEDACVWADIFFDMVSAMGQFVIVIVGMLE
jgi:hypothetical protein